MSKQCEGPLLIAINNEWENLFCWVRDGKFQAFERQKTVSTVASTRVAKIDVILTPDTVYTAAWEPDLAILDKISRKPDIVFPKDPYYFEITANGIQYICVIGQEKDRKRWLSSFGTVLMDLLEKKGRYGRKIEELRSDFQRIHSGIFKKNEVWEPEPISAEEQARLDELERLKTLSTDYNEEVHSNKKSLKRIKHAHKDLKKREHQARLEAEDNEDDDEVYCCRENSRFNIKLDTVIRLLKVLSAYPFVIVISTLNVTNSHPIFRSNAFIRCMNFLIYFVPFVFVDILLSQANSYTVQTMFIGIYISIYLIPVGYVVAQKLKVSSSTSKIEDGTFCFRPASYVQLSFINLVTIQGFLMEFMQHCLFCFPLGMFASEEQSTVEDLPPYIPYVVYFWGAIWAVFLSGLILVLNAVLRGRSHYKFAHKMPLMWLLLYSMGGNGFISCVTVLFMALWCDYDVDGPPLLVQDDSIVCWEKTHTRMAVAALICLAVFLIQFTLLPSGTYKETIRNKLDIIFVPVYLQAHYLLKAIFCGIYVNFYNDDWTRISILTLINILIFLLNSHMKPCSVQTVNICRDAYFMCAVMSGLQSLNYVANSHIRNTPAAELGQQKSLFLATLFTNIAFVLAGMYGFYRYTRRSTSYRIELTFLELEWQVSKRGLVNPRIMEPLISLTLSEKRSEQDIAIKSIERLVWLLSYPNMRVQFQSAWALANLAIIDEDVRIKIHEAGGTKTLFELYKDADFVVQLEMLAAITNLTLSISISQDMLVEFNAVAFFLNIVASNDIKHSQFSSIAVGNLARIENFRKEIIICGGLPVLVNCIFSSNYSKRRYAALALANMALSMDPEIDQIFESKGLLDKLIKMGVRKEAETQREVTALLRNICVHSKLRKHILSRKIMDAVSATKTSVFPEVVEWGDEIIRLLDRGVDDLECETPSEDQSREDEELLRQMTPLEGCVTWTSWGSKLETIFSPVFAQVPNIQGFPVYTAPDTPVDINLSDAVSDRDMRAWSDIMTFKIKEKPLHGKISEFSNSFGTLKYTPKQGYMGTDFFTFKLQLGSLSTILATVAITVDEDERKAKKILEQRKLGAKVLNTKRSTSFINSLRSSLTSGATATRSEVKEQTKSPLAYNHDNKSTEMTETDFSRGRSLTNSHHVTDNVTL